MCLHVRLTTSRSFINLISLQPRSTNDKSNEVWTGRSIYCGNKVRNSFVSTSEQTHHLQTAERLRALEEDNRRLTENLHACLEDIHNMRSSSAAPRPVSPPIHGTLPRPHTFSRQKQRAQSHGSPPSNGHPSSSRHGRRLSRQRKLYSKVRSRHLNVRSTISTQIARGQTDRLRHRTSEANRRCMLRVRRMATTAQAHNPRHQGHQDKTAQTTSKVSKSASMIRLGRFYLLH